MKKPMIFLTILALFLSSFAFSATPSDMLKASYLQMDAVGSLNYIPAPAYASSNVMIFAFADIHSSSINQNYLTAMQNAIQNQSVGTVNFLSIGGQYVGKDTINKNNITSVVNNISAQINAYNIVLKNGKIHGVDLDLENEIDSDVITALAKAFKTEKNLMVSIAPQVINLDHNNVDPLYPINLGLTSGGHNNQYGEAISAGYVDYIMAQTYNTGGWTVGGYEESQVEFFTQIAKALNNSVKEKCPSPSDVLCIPSNVKITVGLPSNAGASGTVNNIYGSNGTTNYSQDQILLKLSDNLSEILSNNPHIAGVMQWSLNNDYLPTGWGDNFATAGAFTTKIFHASSPSPLPYFILQVSNNGSPWLPAYSTVTFVVTHQGSQNWWIFGANAPGVPGTGMAPIAPQENQSWGTRPSANNPNTPRVVESQNLNSLFSNENTSFRTDKIIINGYSSYDTGVNKPDSQAECEAGRNYNFQSGNTYNVIVNTTTGACEIIRL
jgi:chitinase